MAVLDAVASEKETPMLIAKVIPLVESPEVKRQRHEDNNFLHEMRYTWGAGPDRKVTILTAEQATDCARAGAELHERLSKELAGWAAAKKLIEDLFE